MILALDIRLNWAKTVWSYGSAGYEYKTHDSADDFICTRREMESSLLAFFVAPCIELISCGIKQGPFSIECRFATVVGV